MIHKVTKVEPIGPTIDFTKRDQNMQQNFGNSNNHSSPNDSNLSFQEVLEEQLKALEKMNKKQQPPIMEDKEPEGKRLTLTRKLPNNRNLDNHN